MSARPAPGRRRTLAWLMALPLVAAGCATPSAPPSTPPSGVLPPIETSHWSGRFAVTYTEPGVEPREERASGRFTIESRDGITSLELASPLGQALANATLTSDGASLVTSEGKLYEARSAEQLTEQVFGWRMPVGELPRWLRGQLRHPTENTNGRPVAGLDDGWSVRFDAWRDTGPGRLTLDWPAVPHTGQRRINLKLIVDQVS